MQRTEPERQSASQRNDEVELVARLRAGEESAYETLVASYGGRMLHVARRYLRDERDAQDAVQDAFLSAFRAIDRFQHEARLSTWLHRIVVNAALMRIRVRDRRPEEPIEPLLPRFLDDGHFAEAPAEWRLGADRALERAELRERVRAQIDRLPDTYRTVLLLRDIEERDTAETAELLGVSPNAVKIRLHRARQALRTLLDPELREEEPEC